MEKNKIQKLDNFQYKNKLKSGIIAFVLFIILSNNVAYKVLNIIINSFNNNIKIIDENENPLFLGTFIFGIITGVIIFIF